MPEPGFSYDQVQYPSYPYFDTRPEHLELAGWLFRMKPHPVAEARVLEIGCASGGNLIPLAERFPRARFLGIDLAESQIVAGQCTVAELGLQNLELRHFDLTRLDDTFGRFDYIIAHGVYSWVPEPVRAALLDVIRQRLAANGIALVSHNVKPGWHLKAMAREMMRYHVRGMSRLEDRVEQGRAILNMILYGARAKDKLYRALIAEQLEEKAELDDQILYHDDLGEYCEAWYFHEIAERLAQNGLQYLGDANLETMWLGAFVPEVQAVLGRLGSLVEREQYIDFLRNRKFRMTLICHAGIALDHRLVPPQLQNLYVASSARPEGDSAIDVRAGGEVVFRTEFGRAAVEEPLTKAALVTLAAVWPEALSFRELCARTLAIVGVAEPPGRVATVLATELLDCFQGSVVELRLHPPDYARSPSQRPRTLASARLAARTSAKVTNLRHVGVELDARQRELLALLDGTRDGDALCAATGLERAAVDELLTELGRNALLCADPAHESR